MLRQRIQNKNGGLSSSNCSIIELLRRQVSEDTRLKQTILLHLWFKTWQCRCGLTDRKPWSIHYTSPIFTLMFLLLSSSQSLGFSFTHRRTEVWGTSQVINPWGELRLSGSSCSQIGRKSGRWRLLRKKGHWGAYWFSQWILLPLCETRLDKLWRHKNKTQAYSCCHTMPSLTAGKDWSSACSN